MKLHQVISLITVLFSMSVLADEVRMNGALTVLDRVVTPNTAAVEAATGHTLKIIGSGTGRGLMDLLEGRCDLSMASEPLDIAVSATKAMGKEVDDSKLKFTLIRNDEIVFVVNKSNPVSKLTWDQIKKIHLGKITNWKEVGGKDIPIDVFVDTLSGGTRAMVKVKVLGGEEYAPVVKTQASIKKVAEMVDTTEGGIGGVGIGFVEKDDSVKIIQTTKLERPLGFITLGEPAGNVAAVINAFKAQVKK